MGFLQSLRTDLVGNVHVAITLNRASGQADKQRKRPFYH